MTSTAVDALSATLTDAEVRRIFDDVNALWAQADIVWNVSDITREPALAQRRFQRRLERGRSPSVALLGEVVPLDRLSPDGWDVFVGRRLGGAPGVYFPRIPAVLTSEVGPDRRRASPNMVRVLAHELGHALTLEHVRCPDGGNLMSPGCPPLDGGPLSPEQIDRARRQAASGRPYTGPQP